MVYVLLGMIIGWISGNGYWDRQVRRLDLGIWIGVLIYMILGPAIGNELPKKEIVTEQQIFPYSEAKYNRFITVSSNSEGMSYEYITETEKGKHIESLNQVEAYIHEGDYEPMVRIRKEGSFKSNWYWMFAINLKRAPVAKDADFFLPEGAIISDCKSNLQ